ncbi:MAG: formylglycine-generating enzyme family protein [Salinivirgaceae bacterium]|nr:formylglycine-generating enzyme family protein [Salinivirgaceae bacterium]
MKKHRVLFGLIFFLVAMISSCSTISGQEFEVNGVKFKMIAVEGGSFMMGATPGQGTDARENEKPAHKVTVDDFLIGETEVTQELWFAVMGSNPSHFKSKGGNYPVENVSWNDIQVFIKKLNEITGHQFRLPFEAEWEYAARGGKKSTDKKYAGSDDIDEVAWYKDNAEGSTHAVATKKANELGLYDMSGNVWEWCEGHSADNQKLSSHMRGSAYHNAAHIERVTLRYTYPVATRDHSVGFRLAL